MEYTVYSLFMDLCIMSALLLLANFLRSKVRWFQNHYIPSSLIAGFAGLLLGEQVCNLFQWSSQASSYPYLLICILFAGIFLGRRAAGNIKKVFQEVGDTFLINTGSELLCFAIPLLVGGGLIILLFPNVFPEMSLLLPAGFAGGHGYAAAIGGALNGALGRDDAVFIGQTFATFGLLVGLLGGIAVVNYAAKKGATRLVKQASSLPEECRLGLIPEEKRVSMGTETVHPMSMDPLAWNVCLILTASGIGYILQQVLDHFFPDLGFPLMCLTMLAGLLLQKGLEKVHYAEYIDKKVIDRIGGCITDYLVAFGVATIKISVVIEFWQPILLLTAVGIIVPLLIVFVIGRHLFHNFWFERSIFIFGYLTGIVAVGITLLRNVDPEMKTGTLNDFGLAYTVQSVIEVFLVAMIPMAVVSFGCIPSGLVLLAIALAMYLVCGLVYGWKKGAMDELRGGEEEVIAASKLW